jgi:hypothetical protein
MRNYLGVPLLSLAVTACGTTHNFVDQPQLRSAEPDKDAGQATAEVFDLGTPYTVKLCEADRSSKSCKPGEPGITATGVGGLFLPLTLRVTALFVSRESESPDGRVIDASFDSKVDGISPLCRAAQGHIVSRANNTASVQLRSFYCNWVVVGNVLVNADFSIDSIDATERAFTGFYRITFHGTGNAAGSGYYRATIVPAKKS